MSPIVYLNPLAWKLAATEAYKMDLLYIDDLKVYAQSASELSCILKDTNSCMNDIGLQVNRKKCNVIHVERVEMKHEIPGINVSDTPSSPSSSSSSSSSSSWCFIRNGVH